MQKFRSKIDWWVLAFLVCMTGLLVQLLLTMQAKGTMQAYPVHTAVYLLTIVVIWWPVWNTRYRVSEDCLTIRCLFLSWRIPLAQIQKVSPTNNSVASPAMSLKRLKIDYQQDGVNKFVLVSPRHPEQFCAAIKQPLSS